MGGASNAEDDGCPSFPGDIGLPQVLVNNLCGEFAKLMGSDLMGRYHISGQGAGKFAGREASP
eukprot:5509546-Pyramimonas_sp.AAC.1